MCFDQFLCSNNFINILFYLLFFNIKTYFYLNQLWISLVEDQVLVMNPFHHWWDRWFHLSSLWRKILFKVLVVEWFLTIIMPMHHQKLIQDMNQENRKKDKAQKPEMCLICCIINEKIVIPLQIAQLFWKCRYSNLLKWLITKTCLPVSMFKKEEFPHPSNSIKTVQCRRYEPKVAFYQKRVQEIILIRETKAKTDY